MSDHPSKSWFNRNRFRQGMGYLAAVLGIGVMAGVGSFVGTQLGEGEPVAQAPVLPIELNASTGARSKSLSICTGQIANNIEGLFLLDHTTGMLQCWVLNPRTGAIGAVYRANVTVDLNTDRSGEPEFLMATGNFFFDGNISGNNVPGQSICYVADAKSGNVVGYGVQYNRQLEKQRAVQGGGLAVVCRGKARGGDTERDQ